MLDSNAMRFGVFSISLDFELYWGVRDKKRLSNYRENLEGTRDAVGKLLRVFVSNDIHATWATVGFLYFHDIDELLRSLPHSLPSYADCRLSPYEYIRSAVTIDPFYHFAPDTIAEIRRCPGQELGTHTLSHYYCAVPGQTLEQFEADVSKAIAVAREKGISIQCLVFPRNQFTDIHLATLANLGIRCFRGNEASWIYRNHGLACRALRLVDSYLNISGYHTYDIQECLHNRPFNFPASRFLRPYSSRTACLDRMRLHRITKAMSHAATNRRVFHLWWHPHNFGVNTNENIDFLRKIINHFQYLNRTEGMISANLGDLCELAEQASMSKDFGARVEPTRG